MSNNVGFTDARTNYTCILWYLTALEFGNFILYFAAEVPHQKNKAWAITGIAHLLLFTL